MKTGDWPKSRLAILALLIVTPLVTFWPLFGADFTNWDDPQTVEHNPDMSAPLGEAIVKFWSDVRKPQGDLYIPLTRTVWRMLSDLAGADSPEGTFKLDPHVFHVANVVVHIGSILLAFALLRLFVKGAWAACLGALLFGLHPIQVEAVAWVSGLKDVLSGFLSLTTLYAFADSVRVAMQIETQQGKRTSGADNRRWWRRYIIASIALTLALFAKPSAIVVPLLAAIIGLSMVISSGMRNWTGARRRAIHYILVPLLPWSVFVVPFVFVTAMGQSGDPRVLPLAFWQRPLIAGDALAFYVGKVLLPRGLLVGYGRTPVAVVASGQLYWTWLVPLALIAITWILRRRAPLVLTSLLLFFAAPSPVLGLKPFEFQYFSTVANHYLYVAMLGPALLGALVLARYWGRAAAGLACIVLLICAILSFVQSAHWHDTFTLFESNLRVQDNNFVAHRQLGIALAAKKDTQGAALHYEAALRARPDDVQTFSNLGHLLMEDGRTAEALHLFQLALKYRPRDADLWSDLGVVYAKLGRFEEAAYAFTQAAQENPMLAVAQFNLGLLLENAGQGDAAIGHYLKALEIDPTYNAAREALWRLGVAAPAFPR